MADDTQDPLDWLRRLAGPGFADSLEQDAAKGEVAQFAGKLAAAPKEPGYEDRPGTQLSRPDAAYELRKTLSPAAQQLADVGFGQEAQQHNVETFGAAKQAADVAQSRSRFLPVAQAMADLPKTLTLGYGPSFTGLSGHSDEETSGLYQQNVAQAVVQRVREEHPDWTSDQVTKEAQGRYASGGQTIGGGLGGTLLEKAAPVAVNVAGMAAPFGLAAKGAGAILGLTGLGRAAAEGGKLAQVGFQAARGGLAGAAYAGAKAPEVGEAGDLYSRLVRAAKEAPVFAAGDAAASLVRLLPAANAARALTAVGASQEAAAKIAQYAQDAAAGTAQGVAMTASTEEGRRELMQSPGAVIAGAFAAALLPEHFLPKGLRGKAAALDQTIVDAVQRGVGATLPPELAARIPAVRKQLEQEDEARALSLHGAIVDETLDWNRQQTVAALNGMTHAPDWIKDEVLLAHDRRTAAALAPSEGKGFDLATKDFEAGVGQVVLAAQHRAAMDVASASERASNAVAKTFEMLRQPEMMTFLNLPTEVQGVQALLSQVRMRLGERQVPILDTSSPGMAVKPYDPQQPMLDTASAGMATKPVVPPDPRELAALRKSATFLERYLSNLAGNPGMATVDESMTARALAMKQPGAAETEQQNVREAMADNIESAAAPPPQPPAAEVRTPGALWTPPDLEALREQLQTYYRGNDILKVIPPDSQKGQQLAGEQALLKKDLDRAFITKEGRPLDDVIASTPHDSPLWVSNPALSLLGGHLPIVNTATNTLRRDYVEGQSSLPEVGALLPVNEPSVLRKVNGTARLVAQQSGLAGNAEVADKLQEFAQDALMGASQVFARITKGAPRDAAWQQQLVDYATSSAARETKSFAGRYARYLDVQKQARKYVASIDEEVKGAKQQIDESQKVEIAEEDPLGDVKSVLALAAQEGGPLHGDDTGAASMAAALYLKQVALKLAPEGAKRDVGGKGEYALAKDTFIAAHGAGAWKAKTPTERTQIAREMKKVLALKVAALHDYFRQMVKAREITGGPIRYLTKQQRELLGEDGEGGADAVSYLHAGLYIEPRKVMDFVRKAFWDTDEEKRWTLTREDVARKKPMDYFTYLWEKFLGAKERTVGTSNFAKGSELNSQREADRNAMLRRFAKLNDEAYDLPQERKADLGKYLDRYRSINNGTAFDDSAALSKFKETIAAYPPETQKMLLNHAKEFTSIAQDEHAGLAEVRPDVGTVRGYVPRIPKPADKSRAAMLKQDYPDLAQTGEKVDALYNRDLDAERGKPQSQSPMTSAVLSRDSDGDWYDLDPYRAFGRTIASTMDYVGRKRFENWYKSEFGGTYKPFDHIAPGDELHGVLNQFRGGSVSKDDAIKLGGKFYQVDQRATGKDNSFALSVIGDPAQKLHLRVTSGDDGKLTWEKAVTRKGAPGEHGEEAQYVTEWREVTPQIKQGGYSQIRSSDGTVDPRRLDIQQRWLEKNVGRQQVGATMKVVSGLFGLMNVRQFGMLNHVAAVNNLVAHAATSLAEYGPYYVGQSAKDMADPGKRDWLEKQGIIRHDVSDWSLLDPSDPTWKKFKAGVSTAAEKSRILMSTADNMIAGQSYMAGYRRAQDFVKQFGVPEDQAADLRREGVPEEALAETFARRQGQVGAMRTGALMNASNSPGLLNNPIGKLLLQYKRSTLLFASTGVKMANQALTTGNFSPLVRAMAVGALFAWLDKQLGTNMADKFGPRIADLGKDSLGLLTKPSTGKGSPADVWPGLDDPNATTDWGKTENLIGNLRVPLPDPIGAGPALSSAGDFVRWATSMMSGDDRDLAQAYWEQKNLKSRLADAWVPGLAQVRALAAVVDPNLPVTRMQPSGNPDAPWMILGDNGRMQWTGDQDEINRKAMIGAIGSRKTLETFREMDRQRRQDQSDQATRRLARENWFDALQEARQTGSAAKMQEAMQNAAIYHLDNQDYEREDYLRKTLPWARFSGKSQEDIVGIFARRVARLDDFGDKKSTVLEMLNLNVRHPENLSGEAAATYGKLIRALTR